MDRPILMDVPNELVGERVVVRGLRDDDSQAVHDAIVASRDHIRRFLPWADAHQSVDDTLEYIRRSQAQRVLRESFQWGIFARDGFAFLGGAGMHPRDWKVPSFEIGYWLTREAEGHGYVSEAVRLLTRLTFDGFGAKRVMIRCDVANQRSAAVPRRLGFTHEGTLRNTEVHTDGRLHDEHYFSMIPEEYQQAPWRVQDR